MGFEGLWGVGAQTFAVGLATGLATLSGGALALRLQSHRDKLMGFGSGAVMGVALMDLLPEALKLNDASRTLSITALVAAGFIAYLMVHRLSAYLGDRSRRLSKHLGPASLVFHSIMDGLGIGLAFNVSTAAGIIVAVAVLAHDLMDGANTIALGVAGNLGAGSTRRWLVLDALAPMIGIGLSRAIHTSPESLGLLLAIFAGMFLYIGTMELLPHSREGITGGLSTALGAAFMFAVVRISVG